MNNYLYYILILIPALLPASRVTAQTLSEIDAQIQQGQLDKAAAAIDRLAENHPEASKLTYLRGRLAVARGNTTEGVTLLRQAVTANPDNAQFQAGLGTSLVKHAETLPFMERPALYYQSIEAWKTAVDLDADCLEAHIGLAYYYMSAPTMAGGSLVLAEKHVQEVLRLNPEMGKSLLEQVKSRDQPGPPQG